MSETLALKKRKSTDSETSFDALRSEAIGLLQQVSGKVWTDYNLHDPGITILEQLNFAITDLIYRAEFAVEDYLIREDGVIDFDQLALHPPLEAFTCRPATLLDYRKIILDSVGVVDNVWLTPVETGQERGDYLGLYAITVKLDQGLDQKASERALNEVRKVYNSNRNLCEDLADIRLVDELGFELCADIEITSGRRPVDILAEIYFECSRRLAGSVAITDYSTLVEQVDSLDQLLTGPLTRHGYFLDSDFSENQREFLVSTLFHVINSIDGVDHIQQLYLEKDDQQFFDAVVSNGVDQAFCLLIPEAVSDIKIGLSKNGRLVPVSIEELTARYDEINFKFRSSRSTPQLLSFLYELPKGVSRPLDEYSTIQEQFPTTYGISGFGLPESAPTQRKAKASQLKSYLVIFEQLLSNYLANLSAIKSLFSVQKDQRDSYAFSLLDQRQIADIDSIYPEKAFDALRRIMRSYDDYHDRKNRLLDYMLALYGESFAQNSLRHFNYYYDENEVNDVIINNKIDYLQSIIELGRDRAAASDYSARSWNQRAQCGLQLRVGMLLGFDQHAARALTMAIFKQGIRLASHSVYEELKAGSHEFKFIDMEDIDRPSQDSFEHVPAQAFAPGISINTLRQQIGDAIPLKNNVLSDMLLRGGIYLDRYRVGSLTSSQDYQLTFITGANQYWYLGTYETRESAILAANSLRHFLILLNRESEGMHVVEHILLRPESHTDLDWMSPEQQRCFFSLKVSIVFPAWTARCHDPQFRMLAEETVRLNAPAHVSADIFWLEFHKMYEFEMLYEKWLELKSQSHSDRWELEDCARKLIVFLIDNRGTGNNRAVES